MAEPWRKHNVKKLFAFGSAIHDSRRTGESDVDLPCFDMLDDLQQLIGLKVNLVVGKAARNAAITRKIETTQPRAGFP